MKSRKAPLHDLENIMPHLIGIWRKSMKLKGPKDCLQTREFRGVVEAVKKGKEGERCNDIEWISSHLLYHFPIYYQEGLSLIGELPNVPEKVLDIASGAIAFGFSALKHGTKELTAIDKNERILNIGAEVCGRYGFPVKTLCGDPIKNPHLIQGKFDLIILAHCLDDLFPAAHNSFRELQDGWIYSLIKNHLNSKGHLLIVDSSFGEYNHRVLQLRENMVQKGVAIQAPCVFRGNCPVLNNPKNPCYAQREFFKPYLIKEIQRAASINLSSLKMSYVILRSLDEGFPVLNEELFRIISPPVDSHNGKTFYLCGTSGKAKLSSRLKEHPKESKAFEYLKRGELISIAGAYESDRELTIIEGTRVQVNAPLGKPLQEEKDEEKG